MGENLLRDHFHPQNHWWSPKMGQFGRVACKCFIIKIKYKEREQKEKGWVIRDWDYIMLKHSLFQSWIDKMLCLFICITPHGLLFLFFHVKTCYLTAKWFRCKHNTPAPMPPRSQSPFSAFCSSVCCLLYFLSISISSKHYKTVKKNVSNISFEEYSCS